MEMKKAIVVGGSIAGLSCAHALIAAGWTPVVIEKSAAPPDGSPNGAGLGLDPQALRLLNHWIKDPDLLLSSTLPLSIDLNRVTDSEEKISWDLAKDENFGFRAAYWADLHRIIYKALPADIVLWGHQYISFEVSDDRSAVNVKARVFETGNIIEIVGDLLVAADGCLSSIRRHFLPDFKLRYSGYSAWRGVFDCSGQEHAEIISNLRKAYPEFGNCLYFDLADRTHCVLYELKNKRINWIWYINMPEPEMKQGSSVTMKVNDEMVENMHEEAEKVWVPELARVISKTKDPFINVIYDSDPLPQLFWDNVVLVGDAAHPTTPHGVRSTNMSILDAGILGHCLGKWGTKNIDSALREFQTIRLPVVSEQALHARQLGRMKQGLVSFNPKAATPEECPLLLQRNMPYFEGNNAVSNVACE